MEEKTVETGSKQVLRDENGRILPGASLNPGGKPAGIKDKATKIKEAFFETFDKLGGAEALLKWINENRLNRKEFYKMVLQILPKETELSGSFKGEETRIIIVHPIAKNKEGTEHVRQDSNTEAVPE